VTEEDMKSLNASIMDERILAELVSESSVVNF